MVVELGCNPTPVRIQEVTGSPVGLVRCRGSAPSGGWVEAWGLVPWRRGTWRGCCESAWPQKTEGRFQSNIMKAFVDEMNGGERGCATL